MSKNDGNVLDKIIGYVSPKKAFARQQYRTASTALRRYEGAAVSRRTKGWYAPATSPNQETETGLHRLRARSRDLVRNNPWAKKAIQVVENNAVGTGIIPAPDYPKSREARILKVWKEWAGTLACDYDGVNNFAGIQSLVIREIAEAGEVLVRRRRVSDDGLPIPVQLQVVEADLIDTSVFSDRSPRGGYIMQGVEFDSRGKRVGYHLYDRHPGDHLQVTSSFVPAADVLHLYSVERAGQVRGVPWGASTMLRLRDFDDYEDAQLMRQKIAACFSAFVHDGSGGDISPSQASKPNEMVERVEPGIIEHLPPGKQISFANPPKADGYKDYSRNVLLAIAAGYGITYEALTGDLSGVNFSSGRMGWLEFYRNIIAWQQKLLIPRFCDPVWGWFLSGMELTGATPGSGSVHWTPPRREMIDPVKETKALIIAIRARLISWQDAVRQFGADPEMLLKEIKKDQEEFDKAEIISTADPRHDTGEGELNDTEASTAGGET